MDNFTEFNKSETLCEKQEIVSDETGRIACIVFLSGTVAATVYGNLMLIVKVARRKQFHRKINVFVISLAVADLGVGLLVMLPSIVHEFTRILSLEKHVTDRLLFLFDCMFTSSSVMHFTCMNVDRFVAVSKPFSYFRIMTSRVVSLLIVLCWGVPLGISLIIIASTEMKKCDNAIIVNGASALSGAFIAFYLPVFLNFLAIVNIYRNVCYQDKLLCNQIKNNNPGYSERHQKRETRVTRTLVILQSAFTLCTTPFFVLLILEHISGVRNSNTTWFAMSWLGYFNSTINPYLFYFLNKRLKTSR